MLDFNLFTFLKQRYERIFEQRDFFEICVYLMVYILNKICFTHIMRICILDSDDAKASFNINSHFKFQKISPEHLKDYDYNTHRISDKTIEIACHNNDILYIATPINSKKIVSYGWYSINPTVINNEFILHFPDTRLYMFNGYTEPDYRGFRLHALGMQYGALDASTFARDGLVSYVDAENYRSLRSCRRLGYKFIGYIFIFKILGHAWIFHSVGAKKYQVMLKCYKK